MDIKERASLKALAQLTSLNQKVKELEKDLENPPFGIGRDLINLQIDHTLREVATWKFILNRIDE